MRKGLIVAAAIAAAVALVVWIATWFRADDAVATSAAKPWPGGMGTLDSASSRWPALKANAASVKLTTLAAKLPRNEAVDRFIEREIARGELTIGDPPALADVSAIRELLLHEPIVWPSAEGIGDDTGTQTRRGLQMTAGRALVANALTKARANDPAAWDDLLAVWKLARSLDAHPQVMLQTAALSMSRWINAVAWKMPLPAPAWFGEVQARDAVRPLLEAYQHQTASYWHSGAELFPTKWLANSVEHDRRIAEQVLSLTNCDVNVPMNDLGVDLSSVWRRAFRFRAEREATANALRVREGKSIETTSRCSDGGWMFDGTTLRFRREITTAKPDVPMPLVLRVQPQTH